MNWEIMIGVGVPATGAVILLIQKLTKIDTGLGFLQKTVDGLIVRIDGIENRLFSVERRINGIENLLFSVEKYLYKHGHKKHRRKKH